MWGGGPGRTFIPSFHPNGLETGMVTFISPEIARLLAEDRARAATIMRPVNARLHEAQRRRVRESLLLRADPHADSRRS
jgi:hypothetical protein